MIHYLLFPFPLTVREMSSTSCFLLLLVGLFLPVLLTKHVIKEPLQFFLIVCLFSVLTLTSVF